MSVTVLFSPSFSAHSVCCLSDPNGGDQLDAATAAGTHALSPSFSRAGLMKEGRPGASATDTHAD